MANVANKQNMTISIREYTDNQGQQKKVWKTIGEIITWDDGSQSFELWGAGGHVKGNVFDKQENQGQQQQMNQGYQQQPQQGYQQQGNFNPDGSPMNPQQMQQQMQRGAPNPDIHF